MLVLAGIFLSLDWIALYFCRQVILLFSSLFAMLKSVFVIVYKGISWINTNVILLEQKTIATESPVGQLHFSLTDAENIDAHSYNKNEDDISLLPDLPLLDTDRESLERLPHQIL
jgi:hypothetical protein